MTFAKQVARTILATCFFIAIVLTPQSVAQFAIPGVVLDSPAGTIAPPIRLLACELEDTGVLIDGMPALAAGSSFRLLLQFKPDGALLDPIELRVQLDGDAGSRFAWVRPLAAPELREGDAFWSEIQDKLPNFTVVGPATLSIHLARPREPQYSFCLYRARLRVLPATVESTLPASLIQRAWGDQARRLGNATRMAPGDSVSFATVDDGAAIRRVVIIGALRDVTALTADANVRLRLWRGDVQVGPTLGSEIQLSIGERDGLRPGILKGDSTQPFCSFPFPGKTWKGEPLQLHAYLGEIALPVAESIDRIQIEHVGPAGLLDILDVVLIQDAP